MMTSGENTVSRDALLSFLDRLEILRAQKVALADAEKAIFAELRSAGFSDAAAQRILRVPDEDNVNVEEILKLFD